MKVEKLVDMKDKETSDRGFHLPCYEHVQYSTPTQTVQTTSQHYHPLECFHMDLGFAEVFIQILIQDIDITILSTVLNNIKSIPPLQQA